MEEERKWCVYIHTLDINGLIRRYVGLTSQNPPEKRWANGNGYASNIYFYRTIKKYGWDNFNHEIIKDELTQQEAIDLEISTISQYNTTNPSFGFNHTIGGEGMSGITGKNNKKSFGVLQFDLLGNFIEEYGSANEAGRINDIYPICIVNCCNKKLFISDGYIWCYKKNYTETYVDEVIKNRKECFKNKKCNDIPIIVYDIEENFIGRFRSAREFKRQYGFSESAISANAHNKTSCIDNKYWAFFEDDFDENSIQLKKNIIEQDKLAWIESYNKRAGANHFNFNKPADESAGAKLCICSLTDKPVCRKTMIKILNKNGIKITYSRLGKYLRVLSLCGEVFPQKELSRKMIHDLQIIELKDWKG